MFIVNIFIPGRPPRLWIEGRRRTEILNIISFIFAFNYSSKPQISKWLIFSNLQVFKGQQIFKIIKEYHLENLNHPKLNGHVYFGQFRHFCRCVGIIDVIYYYIIWTYNGSTLPEANTRRQEGKYPMIKVLQGCILKLLLHSVNSELILYRTGNTQSAIRLSFVASSSLPLCGLQSTHPPMSGCISPYVVYNVYGRY